MDCHFRIAGTVAFNRLEASRKEIKETIDYDEQRLEAMNKKYDDILRKPHLCSVALELLPHLETRTIL